jgi:hypothetical protein
MHPHLHLNWIAIIVSVVVSWLIGGLWYGPLFNKAWAKEMGFTADMKPTGAELGKVMALNIFGTFLMALVLGHEVLIWRASTWNAGPDHHSAIYGFFAGFMTWLGFVVPIMLNQVAFERKTWKLFGINAGFQFISMQVMAMILSFWR